MAAFSLTLAVFAVWSLTGWALVSLWNGGRNLVRNALLAPCAGASVFVLALFECFRWGVPVQSSGRIVTLLCGVFAAIVIWRRRYPVPWRRLAPFIAVAGIALLLVGYPLLIHGFNWFSYGNDDMTTYVLGAEGVLKRGFLQPYDPARLLNGQDMALARWLYLAVVGERHGCEVMLAWVMSLTGLSGHQIYMPLIVALDISLICAAGALLAQGKKQRLAALVTCAWMAVSSLVTLGTMYQLIAQVFGLGLLCASGALLLDSSSQSSPRSRLKRALLAGILCGAMGISYPEVLPFLVLAFALAHLLKLLRRQEAIRPLLTSTGITVSLGFILWNNYADSIPRFLFRQTGTGLSHASLANSSFPYYLVPSGLATFWGFLAVAQAMSEPAIDIAIAAGALLLLVAAVAILWQAWRGRPVAVIAAIMLALAVNLAFLKSDFGLYKLAMYIQPFLLGSLALACLDSRTQHRKRVLAIRILPLAIVAAFGLSAQIHYVRLSAGVGPRGGGFVEVPEASPRHLLSTLQQMSSAPHRPLIVSDTSNLVLAKVESIYLAPFQQEYTSRQYFFSTVPNPRTSSRWYADFASPGFVSTALNLFESCRERNRRVNFDMHGGPPNTFHVSPGRPDSQTGYSLLASGATLSVLNRFRETGSSGALVNWIDSQQAGNHLIEVDSDLSKNYFQFGAAEGRERVALFPLEPDYFYSSRSMAGAGRYILFEVLRPSPLVRLEVNYTASLKGDGRNIIPPAQTIGADRQILNVLGRGSARLFSAPMEPQSINGRYYVVLDMGADAQTVPQRRSGLMRWFGTSVSLDSRRLTGFLRDVSAVDPNEYAQLAPPIAISQFPRDLASKSLEYSGIYEDGWVAEKSFLTLRQPASRTQLVVRVTVPGLGQAAPVLHVLIDGSEVTSALLKPGGNELRAIVQSPETRRRIDLRFDSGQPLPEPDGRIVSARLEYLGFVSGAGAAHEIAEPPITLTGHWYPFESFAGSTFRWVDNDARFSVTAPAPQQGELAIDLEPGPGMGGKPLMLSLLLPGGATRSLPASTGRRTIRVPLTLGGRMNEFALRCDGGGKSSPSDPRKLNFRVFAITWTPRSHQP